MPVRHLALVFLFGWLSGTQGGTELSLIDKYKHTKKQFCTKLIYLQDNKDTHGQQSIKSPKISLIVKLIFY